MAAIAADENLIAWIEKKAHSSAEMMKDDLKELSDRVGFSMTGIEVAGSPFDEPSNEVVKAYTDTFLKVPKNRSQIVKEWLMKVLWWSKYVVDADVRVEGKEEKEKTEFLMELESSDPRRRPSKRKPSEPLNGGLEKC